MKDKVRNFTAGLIIVTFLSLVIYDVYAYLAGGDSATISVVYLKWSLERPWLIFGLGYLAGHLTWPIRIKENGSMDSSPDKT